MEVNDEMNRLHSYLVSLKDGKCSGKELEKNKYFDSFETLQTAPHLFWVAKNTDDNWEIRAKVKIRLCGPYFEGKCFGVCNDLHLCKNFVISGKYCPGQCKFRLSHDLHDVHNKRVWSLTQCQNGHCITVPQMILIRSSFPRLCNTYKQNGECNKVFCGYLHLCPDIIIGKCTGKCKSWNNAHNWSTEHNKKVLYNFDLSFLKKDRATLITNLLFLKNEGLIANTEKSKGILPCPEKSKGILACPESTIKQYAGSSAVAKATEREKRPLILCQFYLNGNCNKSPCNRLHMCKEFLINGNKCSIGHCKYGFSHDPLDENNAAVLKSHNMDHFPASILFEKLRNSFPRMCKGYETSGTCSSNGCNRMHICQQYVSNSCPNEHCTRSHDFQDTHNHKVLSFFSLDILNVKYIASNILYSKNQYSGGMVTKIDDSLGKSNNSSVSHSDRTVKIPNVEDVFLFVLRSSPSGSCSLLDRNLLHFFDGNKICAEEWFKKQISIFRLSISENSNVNVHVCLSHVEPCTFYWNQGCQDRHCQRFHICKNLLIGECESAMACQANHNFESPREKNLIQVHNLGKLSNEELMIVLRYRYPHICTNYLKQGCNLGENLCCHLHVCSEYMNGLCGKVEGVCKYKHKSALDSDQACRLMKDFNIKFSDFKYCVLQDENICKEIIGSLEAATFDHNIFATQPRETVRKEASEEDIFLFIMKSSGSCPLFDDKLLNFFNLDQTKAKEWFTDHNKTFRLFVSENKEMIVCGCVDDVRPCRFYWMKGGGCRKNRCLMFHICRRLLSGIDHSLISCQSNHDFENPREKNLIREHNLKKLSEDEIIMLLRNRYPYVCSDYLYQHCNLGESLCPNLHICQEYVADKCKKQEGVCKYKHQNALEGEQAHRLMKEFHLDEGEFKLCLMLPKRQESIVSVSRKTVDVEEELNFMKEAAICHHYLAGECDAGTQCKLLHPRQKLSYLWQYRYKIKDAWITLPTDENKLIEKEYCDQSKEHGLIGTAVVIFEYDQSDKCFSGTYINEPAYFRRLSSKSLIGDEKEFGVTEWKWYWYNKPNDWKEYSIGASSFAIEKNFLSNQEGISFTTDQFTYSISFTTMTQCNVDERYGTERKIRRRPVLQSYKQSPTNSSYPLHWPKNCSAGARVKVNTATYNSLKDSFMKSIGTPVRIHDIEEVCNEEFHDKYEGKKHNLEKKVGAIDERLLYHGTEHEIVSPICVQNFDWRLCGKNATAYGKGSYFARDAKYSHGYTTEDSSGTRYMFVANVLVGRFAKGDSSMKRPPGIPSQEHELYDSCVDDVKNPSIFVIFERDQCYPRYLISYSMSTTNITNTPLWGNPASKINPFFPVHQTSASTPASTTTRSGYSTLASSSQQIRPTAPVLGSGRNQQARSNTAQYSYNTRTNQLDTEFSPDGATMNNDYVYGRQRQSSPKKDKDGKCMVS